MEGARQAEDLQEVSADTTDGNHIPSSEAKVGSALDEREHLLAEREKRVSKREEDVKERESALAQTKADIEARETAVKKAEAERDEGYQKAKNKHEQELQDADERSKSIIAEREQRAIKELQEDLARIRAEHDAALKAEAEAQRTSIASERASWAEEHDRQLKELVKLQQQIDKDRGALDAQKSELDRKSEDFDLEQKGFELQRGRFEAHVEKRKDEIDDLAEDRVKARKEEFEAREEESREERERLIEQLLSQDKLLESFEELKKQLGGKSPQTALAELTDLRDEITRLNEEIATGAATRELSERLERTENERDSAQARIRELEEGSVGDRQRKLDYSRMEFELDEARQERDQAQALLKNAQGYQAELEEKLNRYLAAYEKPKAREERIAEIEKPFFELETEQTVDGSLQPGRPKKLKKGERPDEITWLNGIYNDCENYGLHFNPRLLKAFHTSLKTAEWSPITVLAGVSGTGKSELPRLYSHFGGIYFASIPVQPNWDSKESMLGFFNSIDNRFDAEKILRFLAQSQQNWRDDTEDEIGYPGLSDAVCMILLDEMNLAHPELYFAEFLSKFEERRGRDRDHLPAIEVKLGTGMDPYPIPLGRNMLWTGTMNQDETTKSLSDKVLDRSIVMYFPRPTELKRRKKVNSLDESNRGEILHVGTWNSWKVDETDFSDEEILPYKAFVEEMNEALGFVGRAIGHRVWQSVEYYMASYPEVRLSERGSKERARAMHVAFEDQIVQKIMPKLRGIDTAGESEKKCIIPIKNLLLKGVKDVPFNLDKDFELARRLGYGQFVWQSAEYLKEESAEEEQPRATL
ncbi:MAG: hypothetical protein IJI68_05015 [Eggerthellaceae bacterium]|nr:hypothetical protein [Eggerthellaceae bacterium]